MWNQEEEEEEEEEGVLNLEDDFVNYDAFPSFTPDQEEGVGGGGTSDDYTNVMDGLLSMNLLKDNDPTLFSDMEFVEQDNDPILQIDQHNHVGEQSCQDLAMVFFEWLKSNKESISAKDLRNIKLKRTTIESAVKRLGGGKEGMNQLLKLILEWVQHHQLRKKKKIREEQNTSYHMELPQNPNPDLTSNPCPVPSVPQWAPHQQPYVPSMMYVYVGGESFYNNGIISSAQSWPPPNSATHYVNFSDQNRSPSPLPHGVPPVETMSFASSGSTLPCQLYPIPDDGLVKSGASSTKEARKKRMGARQKRVFSRERSYIDHQHQQLHDTNWPSSPLANETNCTNTSQLPNWQLHRYSPPLANAFPSPVPVSEPPPPVQGGQQTIQSRQYHQHSSLDRQKICKTGPGENLRFLMQKVLRQSDVVGLGRIVLPKKEAEAFLPSLEGRDGIYIPMEDVATTQIWNMLYRSWPNNKNRLYMLENAGEFVRSNGLREGDFIVIYSDIKCGKYLIRGVKVRQSEAAKQGKAHTNSTFTIPSSSSAKRTVQ